MNCSNHLRDTRLHLCAFLTVISGAFSSAAGQGWQALGPYGGAAEVVRVSRSQPSSLLAGTRRGIIFQSENGGVNWARIASPAPPDCVLHALEIHPENPAAWYAGFDCGDLVTSRAGLYETADAGKTWRRVEILAGKGVWSLAFSASAKRIAAGTTVGVFLDQGEGWRRISPEANLDLKPVVSIAFDPTDEDVIFAGTTHLPWRTKDGGRTWTSIHSGMLDDSDVFSVSPDRSRKGLVYASACSGAYRSVNGGALWARLPTPRGAFRVYLVAPDPHRAAVVYAATSIGLLRSADSGATWTRLTASIVHSISFHPSLSKLMYVASDRDGVILSRDGGDNFQSINQGLASRPFRGLRVSGDRIYVTAPDGEQPSLFRSMDAGLSWTSDPSWPRGVRFVAVQDGSQDTIFAATSSRVFASRDAGKTWAPLPDPPAGRVRALETTPAGVMVATAGGLFAWTGAAWRLVPLPVSIAAPGLHAGRDGFLAVTGDTEVLISLDGGANWTSCSGMPDARNVHALTGSGGAQPFVLLGTTEGLLRSDEGCRNWTPVRDGLNGDTVSLVALAAPPSPLAFAVQHGVTFVSRTQGRAWTALGDQGRLGEYPLQLQATGGAAVRLFTLFSGIGVMVQGVLPAGENGARAERRVSTLIYSAKQGGFRQ